VSCEWQCRPEGDDEGVPGAVDGDYYYYAEGASEFEASEAGGGFYSTSSLSTCREDDQPGMCTE